MVVQFGYVVLFSVVWPFAPLAALINNLIVLIGWPTPATGLATGAILIVVVSIDAYLRRRTGTA